MSRWVGVLLALAVVSAGCVKSDTVVNLRKDGSGTIVVEELMSPQLVGMLGMAIQRPNAGQPGAATPAQVDSLAMFADQIERKAKEFGDQVQLVSKEPVTGEAGWKGYRLTFRFDDIRAVHLPINSASTVDQEEQPAKKKENLTVEFRPGSRSALRLVPPKAPAEPSAPARTAAAQTPAVDPMQAQMASAMAPMLAGMRVTLRFAVDGRIVSAENATVSADRKSATVFDVPMDKLFGQSEAMTLMMNQSLSDSEKARRLANLKVDGITVADPTRPIVIEFE
jgi:hypothetical protein